MFVWGKSDPAEVQALESKYAAGITREDGERMQEQDSMHDHIQGLEHMVVGQGAWVLFASTAGN